MVEAETKKQAVQFFLEKGILLSPDMLEAEKTPRELFEQLPDSALEKGPLVLSRDVSSLLQTEKREETNWCELERAKAILEKGRNDQVYKQFMGYLNKPEEEKTKEDVQENKSVRVLSSYDKESHKRDIQDFVKHLNRRYKSIESILRNRPELTNTLSIKRILDKKDRGHVSFIGLVQEKRKTKNNNIILTLEDSTGTIKVLINKNKPDIFRLGEDIVLDEIIAVVGVNADKIVFANNVLQPDIPHKEPTKSPKDECVAILSDLHVGSDNFLAEDFSRFIDWINQRKGSEKQKELAGKVKYILLVGDLIDGCGIYPGQDKELVIKDVVSQYEECARLLRQIPAHIQIVICPGNHDAMRIAEPQPELYRDFAGPIHELPNVTLVSNPATVNIGETESFSGFNVLMYHGYSFDFFVANVDSIRNNGGYDRADLIMKFLLKRRHLAPTHTSTLYIPDVEDDPLVIGAVPDLFITGHIHKSVVANYKNTTMVCGSCWQSKTPFQERVGHHPEPSRVPIINLNTRQTKILKFGK